MKNECDQCHITSMTTFTTNPYDLNENVFLCQNCLSISLCSRLHPKNIIYRSNELYDEEEEVCTNSKKI
jgi:hypothetical protein